MLEILLIMVIALIIIAHILIYAIYNNAREIARLKALIEEKNKILDARDFEVMLE